MQAIQAKAGAAAQVPDTGVALAAAVNGIDLERLLTPARACLNCICHEPNATQVSRRMRQPSPDFSTVGWQHRIQGCGEMLCNTSRGPVLGKDQDGRDADRAPPKGRV